MTLAFSLSATFDTTELTRAAVRSPCKAGFEWREILDSKLEELPGYRRHDTGHLNYVECDLETDDSALAAIHCATLSRSIERAFSAAMREAPAD